ncbi:Tat pathway signal sequence domain protein [Streptomyces sp. NPDC057654]|uniref:Tat pathway signal sequence domain protein n=1 Tax=Streptomyces sp. NPDC057654 TaxID=3346196 RepID=UPI00369DC8D8
MSGIGPVEAGDGTAPADERPAPTPTGINPRRWYGRGATRPVRARRTAYALTAACALAAAAGYGYLHTTRQTPLPPPRPNQVTEITYTGRVTPPDRSRRTFAYQLRITVTDGPAVTVESITQPYPGLTITTRPRPPFTLRATAHRSVTVSSTVTRCAGLPHGVELPFLDVTLRSIRAIQNQSFLLGESYARDLSSSLRAICDPQRAATDATP